MSRQRTTNITAKAFAARQMPEEIIAAFRSDLASTI
jgi:hypothetical protein